MQVLDIREHMPPASGLTKKQKAAMEASQQGASGASGLTKKQKKAKKASQQGANGAEPAGPQLTKTQKRRKASRAKSRQDEFVLLSSSGEANRVKKKKRKGGKSGGPAGEADGVKKKKRKGGKFANRKKKET